MNRLLGLALLCALSLLPVAGRAQNALVLSACGGVSPTVNQTYRLTEGPDGKLCVDATVSVSASIAGFLSAQNYATLTATASSSASTAIPAGGTVRVQNVGTTAVSCVLASGAATGLASKIVVQSGATTYLVTTGFDHIACIDQSGSASNLVVLVGGSGLGTDSGGGSSGGGGGAATIADGADVTQGAQADAKSTATDTTPISGISVWKQISASVQAIATSLAGTLTVASHAVTNAGTFLVQAAQSGTWNITNISGTVSLPTGASTAANQATEIASLASIDTKAGLPLPAQAGTTVNIGNMGGLAASGATAVGNPLLGGGRAQSAEGTAVTDGQAVRAAYDLAGKAIVLPYANPENFVSGVVTTAMTGTTSTALTGMGAPAAGLRNYITSCLVSNAHATVGTDMVLQDGSGGTTLATMPAAPGYGGASATFPTPLRQPTTATGIFIANVTTGASTKASCAGYKGV